MARRSIAVVTGTRADYGLLQWLMREISDDPALELRLLVTGTHLLPSFGNTVEAIEADGFEIAARIGILGDGDSPRDVGEATGRGVLGFVDALDRIRPDLVVLLGDRFEALAAAQAALLLGIPLAHLHGGEVTEGALDDAIRHAITKLASLHFVSAEPYRRRVVQMGENPERVHCVGAPGLENLVRLELASRQGLEALLDLSLEPPVFLVTHHPATASGGDPAAEADALFAALEALPHARVILTGSNADAGGRALSARARDFASKHDDRARFVTSLGQKGYLGALRESDVVIGNSSSGILEAPSLGTPTVNVGDRQHGRLLAPSVLCCPPERDAIVEAVARALSDEHREISARRVNPHGEPGPIAARIVAVLRDVDLSGLARKQFHDLETGA